MSTPEVDTNTDTTINTPKGSGVTQMGGRGKWLAHVKRTMKANPGKKLKDVLKMAKKTYKKVTKRGGAVYSPAPVNGGEATTGGRRRKTRKNKKSRKSSRKGGMGDYY